MQFDLFTFIAQVVNFLVLVALLRIFLYKRVVGAMDKREQEVARRWDKAKKKHEEAEQEADKYREQQQELEDRRDELEQEARDKAEEKRKRLLEEARQDVADARQRWRRSLARERGELAGELRRRAAGAVRETVGRVLGQLADENLEERVVERFLGMLDELKDEDRERLDPEDLVVRTAFETGDEPRRRVAEALGGLFDREVSPEFEQDDEVVVGIELESGGTRLGWSAGRFLEELAGRIDKLLREREEEEQEEGKGQREGDEGKEAEGEEAEGEEAEGNVEEGTGREARERKRPGNIDEGQGPGETQEAGGKDADGD